MSYLVEFLLARIAEDEAAALAATRNVWKVDPWRNASGIDFLVVADFDEGPPAFAIKNERDADHIARWDPARVLAECAAKRRLIHACTHEVANWVTVRPGVRQNMPVRVPWGDDDLCEDALRILVFPYADHPDYRQEWAQ